MSTDTIETTSDTTTGDTTIGIAPAPQSRAIARKKRDAQVRRLCRRLRRAAPLGRLDDPLFQPVLQSFAQISILKARAYAELKDKSLLDDRAAN